MVINTITPMAILLAGIMPTETHTEMALSMELQGLGVILIIPMAIPMGTSLQTVDLDAFKQLIIA
jgi:hypothetical protein